MKIWLTGLLLLLPTVAFAQANGGPDAIDPLWGQYTQSCAPGDEYVVTTFVANRCKTLTADNLHGSANILIPWGSQWKITNTVGTDKVRICLHYTQTTSVSAGGIATNGVPPGTTRGQCITVLGGGTDYIKISKSPWFQVLGTSSPRSKLGQCTAVGGSGNKAALYGPCLANSDCGSSGTCSLSLSGEGIYASVCADSTDHEVIFDRCRQ